MPDILLGRDQSEKAVDFNGASRLQRTSSLIGGSVQSDIGLISVWFKQHTSQTGMIFNLGGAPIIIGVGATGRVTITLGDGVSSMMEVLTGVLTINVWHHILISWQNSTANTTERKIYVDDVNEAPDSAGLFTVKFDSAQTRVGDGVGVTQFFNGDIFGLYVNDDEYLNLATTSNRRKFIDSSGNAVPLGRFGENPTGNQPLIYCRGEIDPNTMANNNGTGGSFTINGTLARSTTQP